MGSCSTAEMERPSSPSRASMRDRIQVVGAFFLIYFVWGTTFLAIRVVVTTVPPFFSAALRFLMAGAVLLGIAFIRGSFRVNKQQILNASIIAALMFLLGYGGLFWSEQSVNSGVAALLVATIPVWIALMEIFILKNGSIRPPLIVAIVLGLTGVALLTLKSGHMNVPIIPVVVLMIGQTGWALGTVLSSKISLPESKIVRAGLQMVIGGGLLAIASGMGGELVRFPFLSRQAILALLYLAIPGSVFAFTAYVWLLDRVSPTVIGSYAYVNPVVALIIGHFLGSEPISVRTVGGSGLIIASVIVTLTFARAKHN